MPIRQSPSTSDGLIGGALVVIGFVALIVVAAVELINSGWPPSSDTAQDKPGSSVTPLEKDDLPSTSAFVKDPVEDPNPLSDVEMSEDSSAPVIPNPTDRTVQPQVTQPYPLILDLDEKDAARVEDSSAEVSLDQDQDLRQEDSHTADIHETAVPVANDSSQEWVSLSRPDAESQSFIKASNPDVQPEVPTASFVHADEGRPSEQQDPTVEFSSSSLIDAHTNLHESATTIGSDISPPPSTPEPNNDLFDNSAAAAAVVGHIQTEAEEQAPLNPESSVKFGSVSELLKPRPSIHSLYDSSSNSISRAGAGELSAKKKRGGSFIKKSGTLINKVFKSGKDASSNDASQRLSSSVDTLEHSTNSTAGPDDAAERKKTLTSPSRVSLRSVRSIRGSIKKKFGKSSASDNKDSIFSGFATVGARDEESHPDLHSLPSSQVADDTGPSMLKDMFKVRK